MAVDKNGMGSGSSSNNSSSNSIFEQLCECPLCLEILDLDDKSFFPCTCGYQICRFCWHRILSESDSIEQKGTCPACRKPYTENPANFKPLSVEDVQQKLKQQRKQKDQAKKQKTVDSRRHLADLRVVQKNLVFVVGIPQRIAEPEKLRKNEFFGKFGKIIKIVVNNVAANTQATSYGAYITYQRPEDALRAIQSVNNVPFDGKTIKASLGTTKYCSHFMRNQQCPKGDCMYLHSHGDTDASFTKEDMQNGRHQEYEKKLIEEFNSNGGAPIPPLGAVGAGGAVGGIPKKDTEPKFKRLFKDSVEKEGPSSVVESRLENGHVAEGMNGHNGQSYQPFHTELFLADGDHRGGHNDHRGEDIDFRDHRGEEIDLRDRMGPEIDFRDLRGEEIDFRDHRGEAHRDFHDRMGSEIDFRDRMGPEIDFRDQRGPEIDFRDRMGEGHRDFNDRMGSEIDFRDQRGEGHRDFNDQRGEGHRDFNDQRGEGHRDFNDQRGSEIDFRDQRGSERDRMGSEMDRVGLETDNLSQILSEMKLEGEDLGFDPFYETQKAFEKLIQDEVRTLSSYSNHNSRGMESGPSVEYSPSYFLNNLLQQPPPGFNSQMKDPWGQQTEETADSGWIDPAIIFSQAQGRPFHRPQGGVSRGPPYEMQVAPPGFAQQSTYLQQSQFLNNNFFNNQFPF